MRPKTTELVEHLWASVSTPLNQTSVGADIGAHHEIASRHPDSLRDAYLWSGAATRTRVDGADRRMAKVDFLIATPGGSC